MRAGKSECAHYLELAGAYAKGAEDVRKAVTSHQQTYLDVRRPLTPPPMLNRKPCKSPGIWASCRQVSQGASPPLSEQHQASMCGGSPGKGHAQLHL